MTLKEAIEDMNSANQPYRREIRRVGVRLGYNDVNSTRTTFTLEDVLADDWIGYSLG